MKIGLLLIIIVICGCGQRTDQRTCANFSNTPQLVRFIFADSSLNAKEKTIEQIIRATLLKCNKYLSVDSLNFFIRSSAFQNKESIKKMGGVSGITLDRTNISIYIDTCVDVWEGTLKYAVAHEYNHAYWMKSNFDLKYKWTLINYIVVEGKADYFAHLLYPKVMAPWTDALSDVQESILWVKMKPYLNLADSSLNKEIMFGSRDYPIWTGYTIGFNIVRTAIHNNPSLSVKDWTNLTSDKMLELSNLKLSEH